MTLEQIDPDKLRAEMEALDPDDLEAVYIFPHQVLALLEQIDQAEAERDYRKRENRELRDQLRHMIDSWHSLDAQVARATQAEAERDEWRQTAQDEHAAALDLIEVVKERDARIQAVDAELLYAELHGNPEVWTHDIRRALEG
ncbi:hypothetical protein [Brevibacterium sandarakinum]|uniref:hypothetical protein n=1 Tax=Brevibacterium sandarakinum TaxID=629680 RepID=UPI002656C7B5|nr:hypothetical protein [Brevibacterium sandarakinum]MDN5659011.1 hypothetical protein [Brevibacterium sandarakinum]